MNCFCHVYKEEESVNTYFGEWNDSRAGRQLDSPGLG